MKIQTINNDLQLTCEGVAENQVLLNALKMYADNYMGSNAAHLDLANEMYNKVCDEYVKDVILTDAEKEKYGIK